MAVRGTRGGRSEFPPLGPDELEQIRRVAREWAHVHPEPETPIIELLDGSVMTPVDIARTLDDPQSRNGQTVLGMFAIRLNGFQDYGGVASIDEVLKPFRNDISAWTGQSRRRPSPR
jgi:hypothetical protein